MGKKSLIKDIDVSITKIIDIHLENFVEKLCKVYSLNKEEVMNIFSEDTKTVSTKEILDLSDERLMKANKKELSAICLSKGFKVTGTKGELIDRILGKEVLKEPKKSKVTKEVKKKNIKIESNLKAENIVKKLNKCEPVKIKRNKHGNFEHSETGFILNKETNIVVGKQRENTIEELTEEDIELCNKFKLIYKLPQNLDKNKNLQKEEVEEEYEEEEVEEEYEEEEVEEEEVDEEEYEVEEEVEEEN